jgi:hypothetical protein
MRLKTHFIMCLISTVIIFLTASNASAKVLSKQEKLPSELAYWKAQDIPLREKDISLYY